MQAALPFHILIKPIGPKCNLNCTYCFYLEKQSYFGEGANTRMSEDTLRALIRNGIESMPGDEIPFAWQGGEPTLMGLDFFKKAVAFQKEYSDGRKITNALQTNGTLLDDDWAVFLKENDFLVGLSIDGPPHMHDAYRVTRAGQGAFQDAFRGLKALQKYNVPYNLLTVINAVNVKHPKEVYRFLKETGARYFQFIPLVERAADAAAGRWGLKLSSPPVVGRSFEASSGRAAQLQSRAVTPWSVPSAAYGDFLAEVFSLWVRRDVGRVFVQNFESALCKFCGMKGAGTCTFGEVCGRSLVVEHTGDVYACDHFVYPDYRLGNLNASPLSAMVEDPRQIAFGLAKRDALPGQCRRCPWLFACTGECPKHRFLKTKEGEEGLNYLCAGFQRFFPQAAPYLRAMAKLLEAQKPAADIMPRIKTHPEEFRTQSPSD